ncbi:12753_t:CDS:2 [Ambispora leptoticha]|uniref:12753_t:CDS:1 n=1 Tax=Ambispora leptoticha TaxID=144679 RepID=A0A9N9B803_9GLOM|nr:12753_t:CDS:2 [Ambispora leptoticha]
MGLWLNDMHGNNGRNSTILKVTSDKCNVQIQVYQQPQQHESQHNQQQEDKQQPPNNDAKYLVQVIQVIQRPGSPKIKELDTSSSIDDSRRRHTKTTTTTTKKHTTKTKTTTVIHEKKYDLNPLDDAITVDEFYDSDCSSDSDLSDFEEMFKSRRPRYFDYPFRKKGKKDIHSSSNSFSLRRTTSSPMMRKISLAMQSSATDSVYPTDPESREPLVFSTPSPEPSVPLWSEQVDPDTKKGMDPMAILRQEVIFEIIRTEKEFVEDLKYLLEYYASAILDSNVHVPRSLIQAFHVLPEIYYLHRDTSRQLLNLQAIYPVVPSISHVLSHLASHFRVYDRFLHHHKDAISQIAIARKKTNKFGQLIVMLEAKTMNSGRYCSIESLLTKPIQRLCKYPLLVTTLMRATSPEDKDHSQLRSLFQKLDAAIRELHQERDNRAKKELEQLSRKLSLGFGFMSTPFSVRTSSMSSRIHSQQQPDCNFKLSDVTTPLSTSLRAS